MVISFPNVNHRLLVRQFWTMHLPSTPTFFSLMLTQCVNIVFHWFKEIWCRHKRLSGWQAWKWFKKMLRQMTVMQKLVCCEQWCNGKTATMLVLENLGESLTNQDNWADCYLNLQSFVLCVIHWFMKYIFDDKVNSTFWLLLPGSWFVTCGFLLFAVLCNSRPDTITAL